MENGNRRRKSVELLKSAKEAEESGLKALSTILNALENPVEMN